MNLIYHHVNSAQPSETTQHPCLPPSADPSMSSEAAATAEYGVKIYSWHSNTDPAFILQLFYCKFTLAKVHLVNVVVLFGRRRAPVKLSLGAKLRLLQDLLGSHLWGTCVKSKYPAVVLRWLWDASTLISLSAESLADVRTYQWWLATAAADTGTAIASSSNAAGRKKPLKISSINIHSWMEVKSRCFWLRDRLW